MKVLKYVLEFGVVGAVSAIITKSMIEMAYQVRGYEAIGGEILVPAVIVAVILLGKDIAETIRELMDGEENEHYEH